MVVGQSWDEELRARVADLRLRNRALACELAVCSAQRDELLAVNGRLQRRLTAADLQFDAIGVWDEQVLENARLREALAARDREGD